MKIAMQLASSVHHLRSTGFRDYTRLSTRDAGEPGLLTPNQP
jgi:hypothetical protein